VCSARESDISVELIFMLPLQGLRGYTKAGGIEIRPLLEHQKLSYSRNI
jgi:hypothetical protein